MNPYYKAELTLHRTLRVECLSNQSAFVAPAYEGNCPIAPGQGFPRSPGESSPVAKTSKLCTSSPLGGSHKDRPGWPLNWSATDEHPLSDRAHQQKLWLGSKQHQADAPRWATLSSKLKLLFKKPKWSDPHDFFPTQSCSLPTTQIISTKTVYTDCFENPQIKNTLPTKKKKKK